MLAGLLLLFTLSSASSAPAGLYGTMNAPFQLVWQNLTTGNYTTIGAAYPMLLQADELSAIDMRRKIYYNILYDLSLRSNFLIGLDMETGHVTRNVSVPFFTNGFVGVGESVDVEPQTGHVLLIGQEVLRGQYKVLRVDPVGGTVHEVATIRSLNTLPVLGAASAFDPDMGTEYFMLGYNTSGSIAIDLVVINISSGNYTHTPMNYANGHDFGALHWDAKMKRLVGSGISAAGGSYKRVIVTLDPRTMTWVDKPVTGGYFDEFAGVSGIDSTNSILYMYMQQTGAAPTAPWYVVGTHVDTGAITSHAWACQPLVKCPWTAEFLDAASRAHLMN